MDSPNSFAFKEDNAISWSATGIVPSEYRTGNMVWSPSSTVRLQVVPSAKTAGRDWVSSTAYRATCSSRSRAAASLAAAKLMSAPWRMSMRMSAFPMPI